MTRTRLSIIAFAIPILGACEPTPPSAPPLEAPTSQLCGGEGFQCVFSGTWTLNVSVEDTDVSFTCPGSITIRDHMNRRTFEGNWFLEAAGGCSAGSPVTGDVQGGITRDDGGIGFFLEVPAAEGLVKVEDDIWEDMYGGAGILSPTFLAGCTIHDADNQVNGAILDGGLAGSASAALSCGEQFILVGDNILVIQELVRLRFRFTGAR